MKIICIVEVVNRALPTLNIPNKKGVKSSLTIGKTPDKDIFLFHHVHQKASGNKYKIKDNIQNVFTKFVNEGKTTIRFKVPEHDLAIKCDPIQLKGFLKTLKLCLDGVPSHQLSKINSNDFQVKNLKSVKTKLKITSSEEYPVIEGLPRTLEYLVVNNANQKNLDSRVLRLRNLRVLNLENNCLRTLPEQLGPSLPNLTELHLANNDLGQGWDWRWIVSSNLQKHLRLLDLRHNKIHVLPDRLIKLVNLITLKLDCNQISALPNGIGFMRSLRYFSASSNKFQFLPRSIFCLKLESIDLSGNEFLSPTNYITLAISDFLFVPSLKDIAISAVVNYKLPFSEDSLPQTVIEDLENVSFCICGRPSFSSQPISYIPHTSSDWGSITSSYNCAYIVATSFCSHYCYSKSPAGLMHQFR